MRAFCIIPNRVMLSGLIARPSMPRLPWRPGIANPVFGSELGLAMKNPDGTTMRRNKRPCASNSRTYGPYSSET